MGSSIWIWWFDCEVEVGRKNKEFRKKEETKKILDFENGNSHKFLEFEIGFTMNAVYVGSWHFALTNFNPSKVDVPVVSSLVRV